MKKYKKLLIGGVFLLLSILVIGCKKDEDEPLKPLNLSILQDGKPLDPKQGITFAQGSTVTLTMTGIEGYEVTTSNKEVVRLKVDRTQHSLGLTALKSGIANLKIVYHGYGQTKEVSIAIQVVEMKNPTGLFKNEKPIVSFGYIARKSNQLWATDQVGNLPQKHIKVVSENGPIQSLPIGAKVKVSSTGFSNGIAFSETEFTLVKGKDNFVTFESSDRSYKIVVLN